MDLFVTTHYGRDMTTTPAARKTAPWNQTIVATDAVRWVEWEGSYYRLTLDRNVKMWDIDAVDADGNVTGATTRHGVNLNHSRKIIAGLSR